LKKLLNNWKVIGLLCLTLGLAPYYPEPSIWGKIKWISGGAKGMGWMDWTFFVIHGIPWILLIRLINKEFTDSFD